MKALHFLKLFLIVLVMIIIIDGLWNGLFMVNFYEKGLSSFIRIDNGAFNPNWFAVAIFYLILAMGVTSFVNSDDKFSDAQIFLRGALFGLIVYGIYGFANYALLQDWPMIMTIVIIIWGTMLCGVVSFFANFLERVLR